MVNVYILSFSQLDYGGPSKTSADWWKNSGRGDDIDSKKQFNGTVGVNNEMPNVSSKSSSSSMGTATVTSLTNKTGLIEGVLHTVASMLAGIALGSGFSRTCASSRYYISYNLKKKRNQ